MATKTKKQIEAEVKAAKRMRDLDTIKNPDVWAMWPFLPVKNKTNKTLPKEPDGLYPLATMLAEEGPPYKLYNVNIFNMPKELPEPKWTYQTVEEMLDSGWEVD